MTTLGTRTSGTTVPVTTNKTGTATTRDVMFVTSSTVALFEIGRATRNIPGPAATVRVPGVSAKQGQYGVQKKKKKKRVCDVQPRERCKKRVESRYRRIVGIPTNQRLVSVARSAYGIAGRENAKGVSLTRDNQPFHIVHQQYNIVVTPGQRRLSVSKECCLHSTKKFAKETGKMAVDGRGEKTNDVVGEGVEVVELLLDNESRHRVIYWNGLEESKQQRSSLTAFRNTQTPL